MTSESIQLPEQQAEFIRQNIAAGRFENASEVVRAGLKLLEEYMAAERVKHDELRALLDDAEAGGISSRTFDEIWEQAVLKYKMIDA